MSEPDRSSPKVLEPEDFFVPHEGQNVASSGI